MQEDKVMVVLPGDFLLLGVKGQTTGNKFTLSKVYMVREAGGANGYQSLIDMEQPDTIKLDKIKGVTELHDFNVSFIQHVNGTPIAAKIV